MPKPRRRPGANPVVRAVARANLQRALLDQKIQLYLMEEGAPCADVCVVVAELLAMMVAAAERDVRVGGEAPQVRVMRGAVSACTQMLEDNRYRRANTVALEQGLDAAHELVLRINPAAIAAVRGA